MVPIIQRLSWEATIMMTDPPCQKYGKLSAHQFRGSCQALNGRFWIICLYEPREPEDIGQCAAQQKRDEGDVRESHDNCV
ncbi:hypothetical protein ARZXY2_1285 [Arthrobacter sp. ZXY-2]|uniref:hypothetical protein n=1 Tax=Arthrobacter subterraneus TaxID=335973 RepID=UPI0008A67EC8|nr:hypothetical protein [Arthrobacter subterraneus]AOY70838.1 hypothetical protein ARZXY2_1285 [Arthrobacter sp. ZXY-2]